MFVAVDQLRRAGVLTPGEVATYLEVEELFIEHLPNPDFYADGNTIGAVTWFKAPVPRPMQDGVDVLCAILDAHGVPFDVVRAVEPGAVVYEDEFQVGVVSAFRGEPTPLPAGVVQEVPDVDWYALAEPFVGARAREFLRRAWALERPTLAGQGGFLLLLAALLVEFDVHASDDEVFAGAWCRVAAVPATVALVDALRRNGYGVHLGTNQDAHRAAFLRTAFGYDDLFDTSCYSCELGVAKPDAAFFVEAARRIGAAPETIILVDDDLVNVDAAPAAGMPSIHWTVRDGHEALLAQLGRYGVDGRLTAAPRGRRS